jgi:hypothetical protein
MALQQLHEKGGQLIGSTVRLQVLIGQAPKPCTDSSMDLWVADSCMHHRDRAHNVGQ